MGALSSSATKNGTHIDFRSITDPNVDPGMPGGRELLATAHSATRAVPDPSTAKRLAAVIGTEPAISAVEVAGAFTMINIVMEQTGSHVVSRRIEHLRPILEQIGAMEFPHATLITASEERAGSKLRRVTRRLRR